MTIKEIYGKRKRYMQEHGGRVPEVFFVSEEELTELEIEAIRAKTFFPSTELRLFGILITTRERVRQ